MLRTLKAIIGVHDSRDATVLQLETAIADAHAEIEAAERAHDEAQAAYTAGLIRLDETELQRLVAVRQAAVVRQDRARALVSALAERLAVARDAEEQTRRRAGYEAAQKAQAVAAKALVAEYPKLARSLVAVLRTVAEADALARAANKALPDGVESLSTVEAQVRREPDVPERITKQVDFTAWCRLGGTRLHPDDQPDVKPAGDGRTGTWKPIGADPVPVVLRRFRSVTSVPEAVGRDVASLASTLNLPGLRASHVPFWTAGATDSPAGVLAAIDDLMPNWGKSIAPAVLFQPDPQTTIVALDELADQAA